MVFYTFYTLVLKFYFKKMGKKKDRDDTFLRKKSRRKIKQCYHNDNCRWKKGQFSNEVNDLNKDIKK